MQTNLYFNVNGDDISFGCTSIFNCRYRIVFTVILSARIRTRKLKKESVDCISSLQLMGNSGNNDGEEMRNHTISSISSTKSSDGYRLFGRQGSLHQFLGGGKGTILSITLPAFYAKYEEHVDKYCGMIHRKFSQHYRIVDESLMRRIPLFMQR
ncbi:MATE efflux family protein isoform 1 [Hibiscus syriacus]|uniref:MATE efflux family protein isoform 1 n=1 Tax=Hibiscus syriacus TaxID=106335 RepID=A0A6A2XWT2_HIBSY|nr:MATE efflux family protein isoform 1 [Hibiscus syriacus]